MQFTRVEQFGVISWNHTYTYKLTAKSFISEYGKVDSPSTRSIEDLNFLLVLCSRQEFELEVKQDAAKAFVEKQLYDVSSSLTSVSVFLSTSYIVLNIIFVKLQVVNPIQELIHHIQTPQDSYAIELFINGIKRREIHRMFKIKEWIKLEEARRNIAYRKELDRLIKRYHDSYATLEEL